MCDMVKLVKCGNVREMITGDKIYFKNALERCEKLDHWLYICDSSGVEFENIIVTLAPFSGLPPFLKKSLYSNEVINKPIRMATMGVVTFVMFLDE